MTVAISKGFPNAESLSLVADNQYREPLMSAALNRKNRGIFKKGIYCGFTPVAGDGLTIVIEVDDDDGGSTASIDVGNYYQITIRQQKNITIDVEAGTTKIVALQAVYGVGVETYQVNSSSKIQAAEIVLLDELSSDEELASNQVELCTITIPAGTTQVTADMIDTSNRVAWTMGVELSESINSTSQTVAASSKAVNTLKEYADDTFAKLGENGDISTLTALSKITSDLLISGGLTLSSTFMAKGAATVSGTLTASSSVAIDDTLTVSGESTFVSDVLIGGNETVAGDVSIEGAVTVAEDLSIVGAATFGSSVEVEGDLTLANALSIANGGTGATTVSDALTNLGLSEVVFLSNLIGGAAGSTGLGNKQGAKSYSGNTTLTSEQSGMFIEYAGSSAGTFTLPTAGNVGGTSFTIWNNTTATLTLACSDAYFYGPMGSSTKTKKIYKYQTIEVISDGYNWICHSVGAYADDNISYLPSGLIMQWGTGSDTGSGSRSITQSLNVNFPTKTLFAMAVDVGSGCFSYATGVTTTNVSSFLIYIPAGAIGSSATVQTTGSCGWRWFAIGN